MQESSLTLPGLSLDWLRLLVLLGSAIATLVASVMADEQNQRLRNGAFGTVAGGFVGALMALLTKQDDLVVIGFVGSTVGALLGWLISLLLSFIAATTQVGRTVLEYQIGGWQAVRDRLSLEEREPLLKALKTLVSELRASDESTNRAAQRNGERRTQKPGFCSCH